MKTDTTPDYAREHAITLYDELHGVKYAHTPEWAKPHREEEIKAIIKAFRSFSFPQHAALKRQTANMAFVLFNADLGRSWYDKFTKELAEDRKELNEDPITDPYTANMNLWATSDALFANGADLGAQADR